MNYAAIQCLPSSTQDATRLAAKLGIRVEQMAIHRFPDDELRVTVGSVAPTTILYVPLDQPNEKLVAILFAAEAMRRGGGKRLILLAPYMCYMRQDIAFHQGEAISQKVVGHLIARLVDRVITVDAHLHRTSDIRTVFPGIEVDNLSAMPTIANALERAPPDPATVVVGPDSESRPWVRDLAKRLGLDYTVARKTRYADHTVELALTDLSLLAGRPVLVVDDIVSSGSTLITCAKAAIAAGATVVDAVCTHALFPSEQIVTFAGAGIRSIRSTNSIPHVTNAFVLDDLFVTALRREIESSLSKFPA